MIKQYKTIPDKSYWLKTELSQDLRARIAQDTVMRPSFRFLLNSFKEGERFLEGGSGSGWVVAGLRAKGRDAWGIEYSKELVADFKKQLPELAKFVQFGDARKLPFKDNSFDVYFSPGVLEHYEEEPKECWKLIDEAVRVVKPGGRILITVPTMNLPRWLGYCFAKRRERLHGDKPFYQAIYSRAEFKRKIESKGTIKVIGMTGTGVHDTKLFGIKLFPRFLWRNGLLNRLFTHMTLFQCRNVK